MPAKKTVTKKRSLFSRINFKSPKTRGVLVLLAFALVGGGFMVYRSFAATVTTVQSFSVNAKTIGCVGGSCGQVTSV